MKNDNLKLQKLPVLQSFYYRFGIRLLATASINFKKNLLSETEILGLLKKESDI